MRKPSPSTHALACRLMAASRNGTDPRVADPGLVIERLRISLSRLAGVDGFTSLLRRALALAAAESPALARVEVDATGHLKGLEQLTMEPGADARTEATIAVTAHLLELLVTFIGEPITLRLVREAWPELPLDDPNPSEEDDR